MSKFTKLELKKIMHKATILVAIAVFLLSSFYVILDLKTSYVLDDNGNIITGFSVYRTIKKTTEELEGPLTVDRLKELHYKFNNSTQKEFIDENPRFTIEGGMFNYWSLNILINYLEETIDTHTGMIRLDMPSDELDNFYDKWRTATHEYIYGLEDLNGYNEEEMKIIDKKIDKVKAPFMFKYSYGYIKIMETFQTTYFLYCIFLIFSLGTIFSKDSLSGVDELILSSKCGRKQLAKEKIKAGNLFVIFSYLVFLLIHIVEGGIIAIFHGWGASIQTSYYASLYNINKGTATILIFVVGLLAALFIANIIMYVSMKLKNSKIVIIVLTALIYTSLKYKSSFHPVILQINRFIPVNFVNGINLFHIGSYYFIGNIAIPYLAVTLIVSIVGIIVFRALTINSIKKYYIH